MARGRTAWHAAPRYENDLSLPRSNRVHANTFAARAGRWSAQHRKTAIWGWIAFVVIAFVIGGAVGRKKPTDTSAPASPAAPTSSRSTTSPKDAVREHPDPGAQGRLGQGRERPQGRRRRDRRRLEQAARRRGQVALRRRATRTRSPRTAAPSSSSFKVRGDQDQTAEGDRPASSPRSTA